MLTEWAGQVGREDERGRGLVAPHWSKEWEWKPGGMAAQAGGGGEGEARGGKEHKDCILEPLSLPENPGGISAVEGSPSVTCLFCEECSPVSEQNQLLKHMIIEHKLVIADIKLVADFKRYMQYWKKRFAEQPTTDFCPVIKTNSEAPLEDQDSYFLLCDALPEDRELREKLQQQRLREILEQQQQERYDKDFHGICMFCDKEYTGNRSILLNHMAKDHAFNIGLPDNIVNCKEFLDLLQKKLDSLQCLYCEKIFRDKNTLKDHMRKKQHRRINAKNREYDRFYIINYLEFGKSWEEVQSEDDRELLSNQEEDWSDWEEHPVCAVCLFCEKQTDTTEKLYVHMEEAHGFDLLKIKSEHGLNYYQQVKVVNFIRREIHQCQCYICQEKFPSKKDLVNHMEETKHITSLSARSMWDQPQYYFPTYENDTLLCTLSDSEDELSSEKPKEDIPVISEDVSNIEALKQSSVLNQLLREVMNNEGPGS
uniref:Zinc finger protein 277 n=2 Tax=Anolis carolinensis TaxID=28377 RepID=G1KG84_ANOCA|nr:PREDICTED: zinc finger protein 277 [Anolis carolinensis]|eukprot:XP_003221251.2 PREDICTED: zinc finger protein 277 [Anolis carolinensis]